MAIFGVDDRIPVPDAIITNEPFSAIGLIESHFPDGTITRGTGAMIGPDDFLTAAHCVYSSDYGGWATDVYISPAHSPNGVTIGVTSAENIISVSGWVEFEDFNWDYAYVDLTEEIGYETGWFRMNNIVSTGDLVESLGYPGDYGSVQMVYTSGTVDSIVSNVLQFYDDLDSYQGQSGSPVFYTDPATESLSIVGIVSHERYWPVGTNGVLRLTASMVEQINGWASENEQSEIVKIEFDESWYLQQNQDVEDAVTSGKLPSGSFHYFSSGWLEGRDPCAGFDTSFYLAIYPDVAADGINPLIHYITSGESQGRIPYFDPQYYLEQNPDVAAASVDPEYHYIYAGQFEGRLPAPLKGDDSSYLIMSSTSEADEVIITGIDNTFNRASF